MFSNNGRQLKLSPSSPPQLYTTSNNNSDEKNTRDRLEQKDLPVLSLTFINIKTVIEKKIKFILKIKVIFVPPN